MTTTTFAPIKQDENYREVVLDFLNTQALQGATVTEVKSALDPHHGHTSGALSILHKEGKIARLAQKRRGCKVYVHRDHVFGRLTEPYGRMRPTLTDDEQARFENLREYYMDAGSLDIKFLLSLVERLA